MNENTEELLVENNKGTNKQKRMVIIISVVLVFIIIASTAFMFYQRNMKLIKTLELGQKYLDEEKYEEAILNYEKSISIDDKMVQAYEGKAEGHIGLKEYDVAEKTIEIAQKIETTDYSKILTAEIDANTKRNDEAKKLLNEVKINLEKTGDVRITNRITVVYNQLKDYTSAIEILETTVGKTTEKEALKKLYNKLIDTYVKAGKSNVEIEKLLERAAEATEDAEYTTKQKEKLIVNKPLFSEQPGEFEKAFELELKRNNDKNTIYYTLDGTEPTKNSNQYEKPILIEKGEIIVKAIEINTSGRKSDVSSGIFVIIESPKDKFIENITGMWGHYDYAASLATEGTYVFDGYTMNNKFEKAQRSGNKMVGLGGDGCSADFEIIDVNQNGTVGTIKLHNLYPPNTKSAEGKMMTLNCGQMGDGKMMIDETEFTFYPDGQSRLSKAY
ncbi:MAG: FN3 associated domain-containing protein [Eubacterium sp.]